MPGGQVLLVEESDIEVLHPDHPKVYARWTVIIGGGKIGLKTPLTTHKSTAKLSHIAKVQGRLEPALARGERQSFKRDVLSSRPWVAPGGGKNPTKMG